MLFVTVYARLLGMLRRDKVVVSLLVLGNFAVGGLMFLDPILFGRVIELLGRSATLSHATLWRRAAILLGIWATVGAVGIVANLLVVLHAERLAHRNRVVAMGRFYEHVLSLPLSFHGDRQSGRLMKMLTAGADGMFNLWLTFFREQLAAFLSVIVLLPLTLLMNWRLAIVLIALVAAFACFTALVIRKTEAGQKTVEAFNSQLAGTAQDALSNVMVVQAFTRLGAERRMFAEIGRKVIAHQFPVLNWWAVVNVLTRASSTIAIIAIVVTGTVLHIEGRAAVGQIVAFMGFAGLLIGRLEGAVAFASRLLLQMPGLADYFAVLDARSAVPEQPDAAELQVSQGEVAFENVSFAYPGGPMVLNDVSFIAQPGQSIALVGQTGAGKSTVMSLLQRLWDPVSGRVLIDGQDLRDVSQDSLHRSIGVVFQDSMLFNRTIRENLLVGRPEATDEDLERACRQADAHEFIVRQPQGYDTLVGERGATLSGGQKQRLAIARALLKDPPILILDEATSALDTATEARVNRALRTLMAGRTTFIIAHRLSTVRHADKIMVFEAGQVVEAGSFDALIDRRGVFAELVESQLTGGFAPAAE